VRIAVTHPATTTDPTHVYSVVFALILFGYFVIALRAPGDVTVMWWALGSALCGYAA
jgi:hypothetical protein